MHQTSASAISASFDSTAVSSGLFSRDTMVCQVTRQYAAIVDELGSPDHSAALLALEKIHSGQRLGELPDRLP